MYDAVRPIKREKDGKRGGGGETEGNEKFQSVSFLLSSVSHLSRAILPSGERLPEKRVGGGVRWPLLSSPSLFMPLPLLPSSSSQARYILEEGTEEEGEEGRGNNMSRKSVFRGRGGNKSKKDLEEGQEGIARNKKGHK